MLKKIIISFFIVLVLLGAVVVPKFLDFNNYKDKIIEIVSEKTGRQLSVSGGVEFSLFPSPKFVLKNVMLANAEGFKDPIFMQASLIGIEIDLMSFISGDLMATKIDMQSPMFNLEKKKNGQVNWDLPLLSTGAGVAGSSGFGIVPEVDLDKNPMRMSISKGHLNFVRGESIKKYENLDFSVLMENTNGPYHIDGNFSLNNSFYVASIKTDAFGRNVETSFNISVGQAETATKVGIIGSVKNLYITPEINGSVTVDAAKISGIYEIITGKQLDKLQDNAILLTFNIMKNDSVLDLSNAVFTFGSNRGTVNIKFDYENEAVKKVSGKMAFTGIDINDLKNIIDIKTLSDVFALPEIEIDIIADSILYNGQSFINNKAKIISDNKEFQINGLHTEIGKNTSIDLGIVIENNSDKTMSGIINFVSGDFPAVSEWYFNKKIPFASDTFKNFEVSGNIGGFLGKSIELKNASVTLDKTVASMEKINIDYSGETPTISAIGKVGAINFDNYLSSNLVASPVIREGFEKRDKLAFLIRHFNVFPEYNKKFDLVLDYVNYKSFPVSDAILKLSTSAEGIDIAEFKATVGGIYTSIKGRIDSLNTDNPVFKNANLTLSTKKPAYSKLGDVMKYFDIPLPLNYEDLRYITLNAVINGDNLNTKIDKFDIATSFGTFNFSGTHSDDNTFVGDIDFRLKNLQDFLKSIKIDYSPSKPFGATKLTGKMQINNGEISVSGMDLAVGVEKVAGDIKLSKSENGRDLLQAKLYSNNLTLSEILPENPMNLWYKDINKKLRPDWSKDKINFSIFDTLDVAIVLGFDTLIYDELVLNKGDATLKIQNTKAELNISKASFLDGAFVTKIVSDFDGSPYPFNFEGQISNAKLKTGVFGADIFDIVGGSLSMDYNFKSKGDTVHDVITSFDGEINFDIKDAYIKGANYNKLAEMTSNAFSGAEPMVEKDFIDYVDLYLKQGTTMVPEIEGTVVMKNGNIDINTKEFMITDNSSSTYKATVKLMNWDVSSFWDMKIDGDDRLFYSFNIEGALDAPRKKVFSEDVKQFISATTKKMVAKKQIRAIEINDSFADILKEMQAIMPKIRMVDQQAKDLSDKNPEAVSYYNDIKAFMKAVAIEIKKIKQLYDLETKTQANLEAAELSLTEIESNYNKIDARYKAAVKTVGKVRAEKIVTKILDVEKVAVAIGKNDPEKSEIVQEIVAKADTARKAMALIDKINTNEEALTLEQNLSDLWDRVNYLLNYLKDTASGQISGNMNRYNQESVEKDLPDMPVGGMTMRKSSM